MRFFLWIALLFAFCSAKAKTTDTLWLSLAFYSETLTLPHSGAAIPLVDGMVEENNLVRWYEQLKTNWPHALLLQNLLKQKKQLQLNDWLYYELIWQTAKQLSMGNALQERLISWFLLSESGYDTRITFRGRQIFLYAYTEEGVFDTPMIELETRKFVNLSSIHDGMKNPTGALNMLQFKAAPYGKAFSFSLQPWPLLSPKPIQQTIRFSWQEEAYNLSLTVDQTVANIMQDYPIFAEHRYLEIPLSSTLANTLLPQLAEILEDKTEKEALEILVSFTRTAFDYKDDRDHFGKNKPMIADELFHYSFSDCEDRSALFYNLVRSLLDLPMIIIAYPNHLTIGVALGQEIGPSIQYEGKAYYICDPTGPTNSARIGAVPEGYEEISFEILGQYR